MRREAVHAERPRRHQARGVQPERRAPASWEGSLVPLNSTPTLGAYLGRGVLAGLAGTAVMTVFQRFVEMPLTKREDSYAPASFAEKVLPVQPTSLRGRRALNEGTHMALGTMWGAAYGVAASRGLRGQKAVNVVFGVVYTGDVLLNTALGLYRPREWTGKDWAIDLVDKYVQAQAVGAAFDRLLDPASA